jgi:hypothetical protein
MGWSGGRTRETILREWCGSLLQMKKSEISAPKKPTPLPGKSGERGSANIINEVYGWKVNSDFTEN